MIIVSHLVTYERGERYVLSQWLEEICLKYNIMFINPVRELKARGYDISKAFEKDINHYTKYGHQMIKEVYDDFIKKLKIS